MTCKYFKLSVSTPDTETISQPQPKDTPTNFRNLNGKRLLRDIWSEPKIFGRKELCSLDQKRTITHLDCLFALFQIQE